MRTEVVPGQMRRRRFFFARTLFSCLFVFSRFSVFDSLTLPPSPAACCFSVSCSDYSDPNEAEDVVATPQLEEPSACLLGDFNDGGFFVGDKTATAVKDLEDRAAEETRQGGGDGVEHGGGGDEGREGTWTDEGGDGER
eukprot:GHVS01012710.1.p1 GENE.GHVS01012710.1~~GHVS01012710.1.p1  ORF type:complete len:139 (-),score=37.60 GHVS01012710.1:592-1008(-)